MKKTLIIALVLAVQIQNHAGAQDVDSLMLLVLEHNMSLKVAREASRTAILRAGTGNTPPDPEFEIGYLYGDPAP